MTELTPRVLRGGYAWQDLPLPGFRRVCGSGEWLGRWAQQPSPVADPQISAPSKRSLAGEGVAGAGVTLCRPRSEGGGQLGSSRAARGALGSFREVMLCAAAARAHPWAPGV